MSGIKIEEWNGFEIRFVKVNADWWAVLADIAKAMELSAKGVKRRLPKDVISNYPLMTSGGMQVMIVVNEYGIYETVFESRKKEAKDFKRWVYEMLKELRRASGLEGFQVFRMLDKDHQKEAMRKLKESIQTPVRFDFIKANTIANKATSSIFGYPNLIKKDKMTPNMLVRRQTILDDTVNLMVAKESFNLDLSVSDLVYKKYLH
ncbi:MAG: Bro-N domain-containing protein [Vulcanibacillus sp.]